MAFDFILTRLHFLWTMNRIMIESNTLKATLKIFILQALIFIPIISIAQPSENIGFVIEASGKSKEVV